MARRELARFLRDRRERVRPGDVGLPTGRRRRTPGLRREEVAALAHISVDYYVRLEQARGARPSPRVLQALAGALHLSVAERSHLFRLADAQPAAPPVPVRRVRPYLVDLIRRIPDTAAVVTDATYDVVAANPLARALLGDLDQEPNLARRHFLRVGRVHESQATEGFADLAVARLRGAADRYPRDPVLVDLLAQLHRSSPEFVEVWNSHPVRSPGHRAKTVDHPEVGRLRLNCDVLAVPEDDQQVVFVTADPGSAAFRALRHLSRTR